MEEYTYDAEGNLLKTVDTDPFQLYNKTPKTKFEYTYDAEGNVTHEFKRDTDSVENLKSHTDYTYDALNRLTGSTRSTEGYPDGNTSHTYTYDTLGNLVREVGPTKQDVDTYQYNNLNQMVAKEECGYIQSITNIHNFAYTYDKRGNLVKEEEICSPTTTDPQNITVATYKYDETNRMVQGTNQAGEASLYTFNGLGVRVGTEMILEDNTHGYTDFHCQTPSIETGVGGPQGPEVVKSDYVVDYTRLDIDQRVLLKSEQDGYDFRYVYGLDKLQVRITGEGSDWWGQSVSKCVMMNYVHTNRLGSVVNLSDQHGRVTARADYDDWGDVSAYESITVDGGLRVLLPELTYATHEYDDVLGQFYAKYRMYDASSRRFTAADPVKGNIFDPLSLVQYLYVVDNPLRYSDPLGLDLQSAVEGRLAHLAIELYVISLYPGEVEREVYLKGLFDTKSGGGNADFLKTGIKGKNNKSYTEIYEIKPQGWRYNELLDFLANVQVNSYVFAINNHPEKHNNADYYPAKLGRSMFNELNGVILPFPGNPKAYLRIMTDPKRPGLVYYRKFKCLKENEEVAYTFSKAEEAYFQPYLMYPELYDSDNPYVTNVYDENFFQAVSEWEQQVQVSTYKMGAWGMTSVTFPDGNTLYRCDGPYSIFGKAPNSRNLSTEDLLSLHERGYSFYSEESWRADEMDAFADKACETARDDLELVTMW